MRHRLAALLMAMIIILGSFSLSFGQVSNSALSSLLDEINNMGDDTLALYVGLLDGYLKNDRTIQNFADDVDILYNNFLTDSQRGSLEQKGITPQKLKNDILDLKNWSDKSDYQLLVNHVANRNTTDIMRLLEKNGMLSGTPGGGLPVGGGQLPLPVIPELPIPEAVTPAGKFKDMQPFINISFTDIDNHWAKDNIKRLAGIGIIAGRGQNTYQPNARITRAEFAALMTKLLRLEDNPALTQSSFTDVKGDNWFAKSVRLVTHYGIMKGYGSTFGPNDFITREQLASLLSNSLRYLQETQGFEFGKGSFAVDTYEDKKDISDWAIADVDLVISLKLMIGSTASFSPKAGATRAEAATVLVKLMEMAEL